eukprot:TRINITY_DN575_c0_g2_i1.p1 TRINITY_DN575_c0_g2~~TRINITY_DN575_c0_g2_i1.p1  ORF type:complete len:468 (+),score=139.60 TRINITY_DN575_c0_g2_i1:67-1470(+)
MVKTKEIDHGDGGAFPEIHVSQYPLGMGRPGNSSNALPVTTDADGNIQLTALVRQGHREDKVIYSKATDMLPKTFSEDDMAKPTDEEVAESTAQTRKALDAVISAKMEASKPLADGIAAARDKGTTTFVRYRASQPLSGQEVVEERIIKMVEVPKDPLEPPKFRIRRAPARPPSPPVPVQHDPPRKLTIKDMQNYKVPPCISNWKNPKGYTIPLDKRLAADGRGLQQVQVNDNFAKVSEALYMAEVKAREEVERRKENAKKIALKQKEIRENELRDMARAAREEKATADPLAGAETAEEREQARMRDDARDERRRQWERARRVQERRASYRGGDRELERDASEQFALHGSVQAARTGEGAYDARLFSQDQGVGGEPAADGSHYSKALFGDRERKHGVFRADRRALDEEHERQRGSDGGPRTMEFEKDAAGDDLFGDLFAGVLEQPVGGEKRHGDDSGDDEPKRKRRR